MGMGGRKGLDGRVAGKLSEMPRHPRVEPLTLKSLIQKRGSKPSAVSADATPLSAVKLMAEQDAGAVLVMDDGHVVGIFSERDYTRSAIRSEGASEVRDVMTPCGVQAKVTDSVQDCLRHMKENRLRYLTVAEGREVVAVLSQEEILDGMIGYLEEVFRECEMDRQIVNLRGTYSC
jgi:CBS domain-containing protein